MERTLIGVPSFKSADNVPASHAIFAIGLLAVYGPVCIAAHAACDPEYTSLEMTPQVRAIVFSHMHQVESARCYLRYVNALGDPDEIGQVVTPDVHCHDLNVAADARGPEGCARWNRVDLSEFPAGPTGGQPNQMTANFAVAMKRKGEVMKSELLHVCSRPVLSGLLTMAIALGAQAQGPRYTVEDLGTLGGAYSYAYGVNNRGVVAGGAATQSQTDGLSQTAVLWYRGLPPINLGTLGGVDCPACNSEAGGPNAAGVSAVISETASSDSHGEDVCAFGTHRQCLAAIWKNGKLKALPLLSGGNNSQALWINNRGEVAGFAETSVQDPTCASITPYQMLQIEGVVWEPGGQIRELHPLPGDTISFALGVNEEGQSVGVSGLCSNTNFPFYINPSASASHGVFWDKDGTPIDLGNLGAGTFTVPAAINDLGEVVGASKTEDGTVHPFIWTRETGMQDLGEPEGAFATGIPCCHTINNRGEIVGFSLGANGPHAYLWKHGQMIDLNSVIPADSGWTLMFTQSINDRGQIAGWGISPDGEVHGYLLTPMEQR